VSPRILVLALAGAAALLRPLPLRAQQDVPEAARAYVEEAERQAAAGRPDAAAESWRRAIAAAPEYVTAYVSLGALLAETGKPEEALAVFQQGLAKDPTDTTLLFNASAVSLRLEKLPEALAFVDRAVKASPKEARFHLLRGTLLRRLDRKTEALAAYQEAARLDPRSPQVHFNLGNLYVELGRKEEAVAAFRKALERDPAFLRAQYNLGTVLFDMGRDEEAIKAYEAALDPIQKELTRGRPVEAVHARAFANLGALYMKRKAWEKAIEAYERASKIEPGDATITYNLGFLHYQLGHDDKAAQLYETALKSNRALPLALLHLGLIAERQERPADARRALAEALPLLEKENAREARLALARLDEKSGDLAAAETHLAAVLKLAPDDGTALLALGRLQRRQGRLAEARATLDKARQTSREGGAVLLELAVLARASGERSREKQLYEELLKGSARKEELWAVRVNLALFRLEEGASPAETRQALSAALSTVPGGREEVSRSVRALIALCLAREGKRDEAAQALRKLAAEKPDDATLRQALSAFDAAGGRAPAAAPAGSGALQDYALANQALSSWAAAGKRPADAELAALSRTFPSWWGVELALGEAALQRGEVLDAAKRLSTVLQACRSPLRPPSPAPREGVFAALIAGDAGAPGLCQRARQIGGTTLTQAALGALAEARQRSGQAVAAAAREARSLAEAALELTLDASGRAVALFVKGTADLALGSPEAARESLSSALAGKLPAGLVPPARTNLAVALARTGAAEAALRELKAARAAGAPGEAALDEATLLDDAGRHQEALALYDEYLKGTRSPREDVLARAQALRSAYP